MKFGVPYIVAEGWELQKLYRVVRKRIEGHKFETYFNIINDRRMDICIFQLNIRFPLPVMDLLYLEFLNRLVTNGKILKLIIISSGDHKLARQDVDVWEKHKENIKGIFAKNMEWITIIDAAEAVKCKSASDLLSKDFFDLIHYVSNDFLEKSASDFKLEARHFSEFNRFYPEEHRLGSLYYHLSRGYLIWRYLLEEKIPEEKLVVGHLVWETEVDKLAVCHKMVLEKQQELCAILGKTVKINDWTPIPNFEEAETIYLYQDHERTVEKLNSKSSPELRHYIHILKTILHENYASEISGAKIKDVRINRPPSRQTPKNTEVQTIIDHMDFLRGIYRKQRETVRC